jgi:1-acyl-sn-glycerol-3-phosphate acyltransferase
MGSIWTGTRFAFGTLLLAINTIVHVPFVMIAALLKALMPWSLARRVWNTALMAIAASWIGCNTALLDRFTRWRITTSIDANLDSQGHYLVLANHQSWVDIPVLQAIFNRRIPLLRFFLKSQLFWVPLLGLAWWALDFPFMKRYSREQLERRPELAGRDIEATRRACAKFRDLPVSIMNFAEGTRFTPAKHAKQASPFARLLKPKAGGIAFVLDAMGGALHSILDITIVYPNGRPSMADLFADRIGEVRVEVQQHPIPAELRAGDYQNDPASRERVQAWINSLWSRKDRRIAELLGQGVTR